MSDQSELEPVGGDDSSPIVRLLTSSIGLVAAMLAVMWAVEVVDTFVADDELQTNGILPRRRDGLDGIAWAPFLHVGWDHLTANTVPFAVLGGLVAIGGRRRWLAVTIVVALVGGALTWLLARSGNHLGASGLVFGYFGYLVGAVVFERRFWPVVPAAIAIILYGGAIVSGIVPTEGVSFEGHAFGGVAGLLAARLVSGRRSPEGATPAVP